MDIDPSEMPRWVRYTLNMDLWFVTKAIRPVWWIDYRFHFNSYRQAQAVLVFAWALQLIGFVMLASTKMPLLSHMAFVVASFGYGFVASGWLRKLAKASRDYERDPWRMTMERVFFHWQPIPPLRLMYLVMGTHLFLLMCAVAFMAPFRLARDGGFILFNSWMLLSAVGLYVAAVPPPPGSRKKKEERAPLSALPSPA